MNPCNWVVPGSPETDGNKEFTCAYSVENLAIFFPHAQSAQTVWWLISFLFSFSSPSMTVLVFSEHRMITINALIDLGAAGNFIDFSLCEKWSLISTPCMPSVSVTTLDVWPLHNGAIQRFTQPVSLQIGSLHHEQIQLLIICLASLLTPGWPNIIP